MQVKKQQLELDVEQWTGSKLEKVYVKAVYILSPWLFNLYEEYIMQNARLDEAQAGIKIAGRNMLESRLQGEISITSDMQMKPPLWQKAKN